MKSLFYKIIGIFGFIFAIFQFGKGAGKKQIKNDINKQILEDVRKTNKTDKDIDNMSRNDLRKFLQ